MSKRIVVVDEDEALRKTVQKRLLSEGYLAVHRTYDQFAKDNDVYDLAVVEKVFALGSVSREPTQEIISHIRRTNSRIPVVLYTTLPLPDDREVFDADYVVTKGSGSLDKLVSAISNFFTP